MLVTSPPLLTSSRLIRLESVESVDSVEKRFSLCCWLLGCFVQCLVQTVQSHVRPRKTTAATLPQICIQRRYSRSKVQTSKQTDLTEN